ncbi:hypothetical protein [Neorhodopirellula pilleata]|uniref:hypothetical protein n=1 Tax=Neorhodopirellula pilleata TaxID=2714738 RepID=UPI001E419864|nr:hypothetical protein [Neorhodopirellula pilleata]
MEPFKGKTLLSLFLQVQVMVHRIRLRHPWTREACTVDDHRVAFTRRFNRPTGLTTTDRLDVEMLGHVGQIVLIELNEQSLQSDTSAEPIRIDVRAAIRDHNELRIVLRRDGDWPELGEVSLRIESEG